MKPFRWHLGFRQRDPVVLFVVRGELIFYHQRSPRWVRKTAPAGVIVLTITLELGRVGIRDLRTQPEMEDVRCS